MCGKQICLIDQIEILAPHLLETFPEPPEGDIVDVGSFFKRLNQKMALRGNIRVAKFVEGSTEDMKKEIDHLFERIKPDRGFILSSSDGLPYQTSVENLQVMCEHAKTL